MLHHTLLHSFCQADSFSRVTCRYPYRCAACPPRSPSPPFSSYPLETPALPHRSSILDRPSIDELKKNNRRTGEASTQPTRLAKLLPLTHHSTDTTPTLSAHCRPSGQSVFRWRGGSRWYRPVRHPRSSGILGWRSFFIRQKNGFGRLDGVSIMLRLSLPRTYSYVVRLCHAKAGGDSQRLFRQATNKEALRHKKLYKAMYSIDSDCFITTIKYTPAA